MCLLYIVPISLTILKLHLSNQPICLCFRPMISLGAVSSTQGQTPLLRPQTWPRAVAGIFPTPSQISLGVRETRENPDKHKRIK